MGTLRPPNGSNFTMEDPTEWRVHPPPQWVVPGIIRRGQLMLLTADPGCGKSLFAAGLGAAASLKQPFLDHDRPGEVMNVAYLGLDGPLWDYMNFIPRVCRGMGTSPGPDDHFPFHMFHSKNPIDIREASKHPKPDVTPEGRDLNGLITVGTVPWGMTEDWTAQGDYVSPNLIERPPDLIILDCLRKLHKGEENDSADMTAVCDRLQAAAAYGTGIAIIIIHHENKMNEGRSTLNARGSSVLSGSIDLHLSLKAPLKLASTGKKVITGTWLKGRGADDRPEFTYTQTWDTKTVVFSSSSAVTKTDVGLKHLRLLENEGKALAHRVIVKKCAMDPQVLKKALERWTRKKTEEGWLWYPPPPKERALDPAEAEGFDMGGNRGDSAV